MEYHLSGRGSKKCVMISGFGAKYMVWKPLIQKIKEQTADYQYCVIELNDVLSTDKMAFNLLESLQIENLCKYTFTDVFTLFESDLQF